jgi:hypothetical protein
VNKFVQPPLYANSEAAAHKPFGIAHAFQPIQDGRIYIEVDQKPDAIRARGDAGRIQGWPCLPVERGWLDLHEGGTLVRITQVGKDLLA